MIGTLLIIIITIGLTRLFPLPSTPVQVQIILGYMNAVCSLIKLPFVSWFLRRIPKSTPINRALCLLEVQCKCVMDPTPIVISLLTTIIPKLYTFISGQYNLEETIRQDIRSIKNELDMMLSAIQDYSCLLMTTRSGDGRHHHQLGAGAVQATWIEKVRTLAHQMEDCIDSYIYDQMAPHGSRRQGPARLASEVRELRSRSAELSQLNQQYGAAVLSREYITIGDSGGGSTLSSAAPLSTFSDELVGMEARRRELLELVNGEGQPEQQRKVISIVGFGGLGKTVLANQVYCDTDELNFSPRAWVSAAEKTAGEVLMEILQRFEVRVRDVSDVDQLSKRLREHLRNKR